MVSSASGPLRRLWSRGWLEIESSRSVTAPGGSVPKTALPHGCGQEKAQCTGSLPLHGAAGAAA